MQKAYLIITAILMGLVLNSCSVNPVTGKKQLVFMSEEQEIAMGQQADPEIVAMFGLYQDPVLQKFIDEKGQEMAKISHRPNLKYEFKVVDSPILNAFAVPGGYVYFTRGIMAHFNNEAEFAGVLGHEIGHITARHSVVQQRNQILGQIGLIAGIVLVPEIAQFAEPASAGLGLLLMRFGRDAERQSDELGVEYSSKIGYDARQMGKFFNTLERQSAASGQGEIPEFLSTHPSPANRSRDVEKMAVDWIAKLSLNNPNVNRNSYLDKIDGLIYGDDPKQGYLENNIFYHPELKFQFPVPQGWSYSNTPQAVQMAPKDGKAVLMMTLAQANTLNAAADSTLSRYKLNTVSRTNLTINGLPALELVADQVSQTATMRTLNYFIQYGGLIYHFLGASAAADYNSYVSSFQNTSKQFRALTDAAKLNKKAERVRIKSVTKAGTLKEVLNSFSMPAARHDELAILNGMTLNEQVAQGTRIKIVGL